MKRATFIKGCLTATTAFVAPLQFFGRSFDRKRVKTGIQVSAGEDRFGKPLSPFEGDKFFCKVSSKDTAGDLYIFDSTRLHEGGPPLHVHPDQDEWWYIISGEYMVKVGDEIYHTKAGDCVFGPRGVPHTFAKVGEVESKLIMLFQPAGKMEEYFEAAAAGKVAKMSAEKQAEFRKQHGFVHVGPPLTNWKKPVSQ